MDIIIGRNDDGYFIKILGMNMEIHNILTHASAVKNANSVAELFADKDETIHIHDRTGRW